MVAHCMGKSKHFLQKIQSGVNAVSRIKLVISSFLFDKLVMGSALNYAALFKHYDTVAVSDC